MSNQIQSRCIDVPSIRPCTHRQRNLFTHEAPCQVRIKRNIHQKLGMREKESGRNVRNLRRTWRIRIGTTIRVDADDVLFDLTVGEHARTQSCTRRPAFVLAIKVLESRRVGAEHAFGIILGQFDFLDVLRIPMFRKFQVAVHLHEIVFASPQFAGVVSCDGWSQRVRFVHVDDTNLSRFAVLGVIGRMAKFFNAILVGGCIGDFGHVAPLLVLANDFHSGPALHAVLQTKAILNDDTEKDVIGILGLIECACEGWE
mmetsp:Transcript_10065/g.28641  ORF Transcript_10065/g.28641 Transcript_10065/m.28641 type:complete len:257 (-) Transcript_10065:7-777(-)